MGTPGSAVQLFAEDAGTNCVNGGVRLIIDGVEQFLCSGEPGATGATGPIGPVGPQGEAVVASSEGPSSNCPTGGTRFEVGSTVTYACNGEVGATGPQGAQGAQGPQGLQGIQGLIGPQGPQGDTGAQGPQGATGSQGPQGNIGPQGPAGPQGTSVVAASLGVGNANCATGGSSFTVGSTTTYACNGTQGPQGIQGTTGAQGAQGPAGAQGIQGPQGPQGPAGAPNIFGDGSAGALNVTTSTDWSVNPPAGGNYQWTSCTIGNNVTLTVPSGITIRCNGAFNLGANSVIVVKSWVTSTAYAVGALMPGYAQIQNANGRPAPDTAAVPLSSAYNITAVPQLGGGVGVGSGTSLGGIGGGTFGIRAKNGITLQSTSSIRANGGAAGATPDTTGGGGGAGGIVVLVWGSGSTLTASGATIQAIGGAGMNGTSRGGGGGGGGIVRFIGPGATTTSVTAQLGGGAFGTVTAGSGTTSGSGAGGACGGYGGAVGYGTGTVLTPNNTYVDARAGGPGYVAATNVTDPSGLF